MNATAIAPPVAPAMSPTTSSFVSIPAAEDVQRLCRGAERSMSLNGEGSEVAAARKWHAWQAIDITPVFGFVRQKGGRPRSRDRGLPTEGAVPGLRPNRVRYYATARPRHGGRDRGLRVPRRPSPAGR